MVRSIFPPKSEEVTGDRRKLRSEELYDMYWQHNVRNMRWVVSVECVGENRDACTALWVILKESSDIYFETVPSFTTAP
jgi:hypothetical protein